MTPSEQRKFSAHISGALGRIDLAAEILRTTHLRSDDIMQAAGALTRIEKQLEALQDDVIAMTTEPKAEAVKR